MIGVLTAKFIETLFTDKVNGKPVKLYQRKNGTKFMAHSKFGALFFKVEKNES